MSEMDDGASEDFMEYEDSDDGFDSGADSDASAGIDDGPAIERQISEYKVLNAGDCSAAAQKQVREVAELKSRLATAGSPNPMMRGSSSNKRTKTTTTR